MTRDWTATGSDRTLDWRRLADIGDAFGSEAIMGDQWMTPSGYDAGYNAG